ncbi:MAG: two-component regulator propeller domain-containing protein [Nitrospinaceae bacterium]
MKRFAVLLIFSFILQALTGQAAAFDKPLSPETAREDSPDILRAKTFELNTRNIKVLKQSGNSLWMGTSTGVIRYDTSTAESYEVFDNKNGLLSNGIFSIVLDQNRMPWVGTYGGGLSYYDGKRWSNINTPHGLCDAFVYDVKFTGDTMWIATWSGANRVRGDPYSRASWESFTVENTGGGLIDDWVYALEIGKDGRIWFGTENGISVFDGSQWRAWNHENGLGASYESVKKDNRQVVSALQGSHHSRSAPHLPNIETQGYRPNYVVSMRMDHKERLWIGTWGGGLSVFDTKTHRFRNYTVANGLPGNFVLAIEEGPLGNLWIGTNGGLSRFDGTTFENYSKINGLISDYVFSLEFGSGHSLWLGGHYGMNRLTLDPATGELHKIQ